MKKKQDPIWNNSMNYGAIVGFTLVIYYVVLYLFGFNNNLFFNLIMLVILSGGIMIGTTTLRDNELDGSITFPKALKSGMLISLFSVIILAFFLYIIFAFISPNLIERSLSIQEVKLIEKGRLTVERIEQIIGFLKRAMNPLIASTLTIPIFLIFGFLISLLTSSILKK